MNAARDFQAFRGVTPPLGKRRTRTVPTPSGLVPTLAAHAPLGGFTSWVDSVAFSPDGRLLAAASTDNKVWLWDIARPAHPKRLAVLGGFAGYAECVTFTPEAAPSSPAGAIRP